MINLVMVGIQGYGGALPVPFHTGDRAAGLKTFPCCENAKMMELSGNSAGDVIRLVLVSLRLFPVSC